MAINIQEILHPSDSDVIKFEKINYNFDQIVAAGGGPVGPQGDKGDPGTPGFTGPKGAQGEKGAKGLTGATTSPWKVIPIDSDAGQPLGDGVNDYVILKPKQSTDNLRPIIFLGDETFDDENEVDGNLNLRSTLTIGRHAVGVNNSSDEYLTFWHGTNTLTNEQVAITLSSSEETDSVENWTRFSLDKTYNSSNTNDVELRINLDRIKLEGHVTIGTAGSLLLNNTDLGAAMPSAGMIRYNSNSKTFQGGVLQSDNTTVQWIDFCMAPCGQGGGGTIAIDPPGDLNLYSNGSEGEIAIDPTDDLELNDSGETWGGPTPSTTTQAPTTQAPTTQAPTTQAPTTTTEATTTVPDPQYTQLLLTPSSSVNEGNTVTVTANGNYIPNGTEVFVQISGNGVIGADDFTGGISSGAGSGNPYGGTGGGYADGVMLTFNSNNASATLTVSEDLTTEGNETATFTMYSIDSAGNATGGLSDSVIINDTSRLYTATFLGGQGAYGACTNPSFGQWSANYDGTTSDLITKMDNAGAQAGSYTHAEVQSDDGPNAINHVGYVFEIGVTSTAGQACSGVTTTQTPTTQDSSSGSGCVEYYMGNTGSYSYTHTFNTGGCSGSGSVTSSTSYNTGSNTFCSSEPQATLQIGLPYNIFVSPTGGSC